MSFRLKGIRNCNEKNNNKRCLSIGPLVSVANQNFWLWPAKLSILPVVGDDTYT